MPLVEARARGCQVIASDLDVFKELADEGVALFARGSTDELEALVIKHMKRERQINFRPIEVTSWHHSSMLLISEIEKLTKCKQEI